MIRTKKVFQCRNRRNDCWIPHLTWTTSLSSVSWILSLHMSLLFCCGDLGAQRAFTAQAGGLSVDTALRLRWLRLSSSCCVGCTPFKSSLPSISSSRSPPLGQTPSPTTISTYLPPLSLTSPAVHPAPFVYSTLTSILNQLSFTSLFLKPIALLLWLSLAAHVELIHELVFGHCNQPLFVAHYQLPGAELFSSAQWPFVVWSCSLAQHRGRENKRCAIWAYTPKDIHIHYRERENNWR